MDLQMQSPVGARMIYEGREVDYFGGCGYLGLQSHPEVVRAAVEAVQRWGFSTATSRGGLGEHPLYNALEVAACTTFGAERILYFATGYLGSSILTQATSGLFEHIFIDTDAHFSLWDAAYATNKPISPFRHCTPESLAEHLRQELEPGERPLVLSDGLFPISGEIAPLPEYLVLAEQYSGRVYLDDAHAVGALGENGRGVPEYFGIQNEYCRTSATLSKAFGGAGGIIWGEADWVDEVERNSRICVGSSPPPLAAAAASAQALQIAVSNPDLRRRLWENVARARKGLRGLGWIVADNPSPIICLEGREGLRLGQLQVKLFERGVAVEFVRDYTSTPAGGGLRIAIFATHSLEQIDRLVSTIEECV